MGVIGQEANARQGQGTAQDDADGAFQVRERRLREISRRTDDDTGTG